MRPIPEPDFAYIPGQTPRHPETAFDDLRQTARAGMSVTQLVQSEAWAAGLYYLGAGYFWEAHEVTEAVWMALPAGPERHLARAVIQIANAELKRKMGRMNAVARLCGLAEDLLQDVTVESAEGMGVALSDLLSRVKTLRISANLPERS